MKSLVVTFSAPRTVELREEEVGDPGPGEILVQTVVSLVSTGTESLCFENDFDADSRWASVRFPHSPGYSNVGRVLKVGKGVTQFAEGDRVFTVSSHRQFARVAADHPKSAKLPDHTAGDCPSPQKGLSPFPVAGDCPSPQKGLPPFPAAGDCPSPQKGLSPFPVAPAPVPALLAPSRRRKGDSPLRTGGQSPFPLFTPTKDEDATWSWLAVVTQTGVRRAEHAIGETAAVIGLGPLGQLTVQYLRLAGLREVLAIDPVQARLDAAIAHGATAVFCGSAADALDFVEAHTDGQRADAVYDVTGHDAVFPLAQRLARTLGTVVVIGDAPHPSRQHLTHDVVRRQLTIVGTQNDFLPPQHAAWCAARQIPLFYHYLRTGQMRVSDLVTHRFAPTEAAAAYALLQEHRGDTLGVLFRWP